MKPRQIVRQARYERDLEKIFREVPRADEAVRGLEWTIARHPEWGYTVRGYPGEVVSWVAHFAGTSVQVIYRFTEEEVICLAARQVPSGNPWD